MTKLIGIIMFVTGIATSPSLAQSFDPDNGTGNLISATVAAPAPARADGEIVTGSLGTEAFAMSARRKANAGTGMSNNVGAGHDDTGGGSVGYNELLRNW